MGAKVPCTAVVYLTEVEQAAMMDRLDQPDLIASVLTDHAEGDKPAVPELPAIVEERVRVLARLVGGPGRQIPPIYTDLDRAILIEAIEGSTWVAGFETHERWRRDAARRTLYRIANKMIAAGICRTIEVP